MRGMPGLFRDVLLRHLEKSTASRGPACINAKWPGAISTFMNCEGTYCGSVILSARRAHRVALSERLVRAVLQPGAQGRCGAYRALHRQGVGGLSHRVG